jgi:hypothetical protein
MRKFKLLMDVASLFDLRVCDAKPFHRLAGKAALVVVVGGRLAQHRERRVRD